jgi:chaperonin GroEL
MQDIAITLGAKYISEKTGDDLSTLSITDLGHADKIIVGKTNTVLIKNEDPSEEMRVRISELKEQQSNLKDPVEKKFVDERIASLAGAIGCIYVGGNSDVEQKEKFDRVDDSVCAVRSALEEGIVPGGGIALLNCAKNLGQDDKAKESEWLVAKDIITEAMQAPFQQILINAGMDPEKILADLKKNKSFGFDVKNEEYGDMYKMGVIDPLKVTRNALINAVSVATTILTTNAIVTHARVGNRDQSNNKN